MGLLQARCLSPLHSWRCEPPHLSPSPGVPSQPNLLPQAPWRTPCVGGEGSEGGEGDTECTCGMYRCECAWYKAMSKKERRSHKQKLRNKRRDEKQVCTDSRSNLTAEP